MKQYKDFHGQCFGTGRFLFPEDNVLDFFLPLGYDDSENISRTVPAARETKLQRDTEEQSCFSAL